MRSMHNKRKQIALLLLTSLFACFAPIETMASDDCDFSKANLPTPSCSISYSDYVYISWSALSGDCSSRVRNYVVYRSTSSTFSWSEVTKLCTTTNKYYYDRSCGTYYYWIGVTDDKTGLIYVDYNKKDWGRRNADGCSCSFSTIDLPMPSCSTSHCDYIIISWSAPKLCSPSVRNYVLYRSTSSTFNWSTTTRLGTTTGTTYYDRTAACGTTYYYWIGMTDSRTGSIWVNYNNKCRGRRNCCDDCDFSKANLPMPSCSTSYCDYVSIGWSSISGDCSSRVRNYVVYRSTSSTFNWGTITKLGTTTGTTYYDRTAAYGTSYYYWIGVTDNDTGLIYVNYSKKDMGTRNSSGCDDCDFSKANLPMPSCSDSYSYVDISWSAMTGSCSSRVRNYVVYRSTSSTFNWSTITKLGTTTGKTYYDRTAVGGTTYYYWIGVTDSITGSIWVNYNKKEYVRRAYY